MSDARRELCATVGSIIAVVILVGCFGINAGCVNTHGSDIHLTGHEQLVTVKSGGPFGTPMPSDKATAQAIVAAAMDQSTTVAAQNKFHNLMFGPNVTMLIEDTDALVIEGHAGDYMHVMLNTGPYKGYDGWLLPDAHFR